MGSSLRVGIDIHSIGSKKGGNETYYRELVRGLETVPSPHDLILYYTNPAARPACQSRWPFHPAVGSSVAARLADSVRISLANAER